MAHLIKTTLIKSVKSLAALALLMPAAGFAADAYPSKPISLIANYPPGGSVDAAARILQDPLGAALGQTIVVENKGGAGGTIGAGSVAKSKPDGHTILLTLSSHTINPAIYSSLPFDTLKDFTPVSMVASAPQILVAHPSFPASNVKELMEHAKKSANPVPYGSAGTGSPSHIAGELFNQRTGLKLMHVPYRGGGPAVVDVVGGQIPLLWVSLPAVTSFIKSGQLKALAVSTVKRTPVMPEVPAMSETVPDFNVDSWYAMFVPAGTPAPVVDKIYKAVAKVTKDEKIQKAFIAQGAVAVGGTPQELDQVVKTEVPMWKELAEKAQIRVN